MKWYDISRELTAAPVYGGDPSPRLIPVQRMEFGDVCNLTELSLSAHNGTHMDAPRHFIPDGTDIDAVSLEKCCGRCRVIAYEGILLGDEAEKMLEKYPYERILFKGNMSLDLSAAYVLSDTVTAVIGVESTSVARADQTAAVHRHLLGSDILILEGLSLSEVPEGEYLLVAAPIRIAGCDGAPVRALLADVGGDRTLDIEPAFARR